MGVDFFFCTTPVEAFCQTKNNSVRQYHIFVYVFMYNICRRDLQKLTELGTHILVKIHKYLAKIRPM